MRVECGQLWSVALDPTIANEQGGTRPCLAVSVDRFNSMPIRHAIIVPLTTRERGFEHHIRVADDGGLSRPSWAMCEAVRSVSTRRFGRLIGLASAETLDAVMRIVRLWIARPGD